MWSAGWSVFYFHFGLYSASLLREVPVSFFLMVFVLLMVTAVKNKRTLTLAIACVALVFLIHMDTRFLGYVPFLLVYLVIMEGHWQRGLKRAGVFAAVFVLAMLPFQIRNYIVYDQIVLVNTRTLVMSPPWKEDREKVAKGLAMLAVTDPDANGHGSATRWLRRRWYRFNNFFKYLVG